MDNLGTPCILCGTEVNCTLFRAFFGKKLGAGSGVRAVAQPGSPTPAPTQAPQPSVKQSWKPDLQTGPRRSSKPEFPVVYGQWYAFFEHFFLLRPVQRCNRCASN